MLGSDDLKCRLQGSAGWLIYGFIGFMLKAVSGFKALTAAPYHYKLDNCHRIQLQSKKAGLRLITVSRAGTDSLDG